MNCDRCGQDNGDVFGKRPAIPAGEFWCGSCCDQQGIALGPWRDWQPLGSGNHIREQWEAAQRVRKQAEIDRLREAKGQGRFYAKEERT